MSYLVFARKWRPQTFEDVVGQEHVTTTLKNAILQDRVAHAYLFSGPRGVGKTTTARIYAKALNCQSSDKPVPTPCNKCESCIEIKDGRSLDVIEIDGASNRGIEEIRQLRENAKFGPSKSRYKVYIIDEVHQITQDGFNALLKTLEEPPPHVKFVFATTHSHKVIATILSRCQKFDFKRVGVSQLVEKLKAIARVEKVNIDEEALFVIARASDGSVRDAESILDQLVSFSAERVTVGCVVSLLGSIEQDALFEISQLIIDSNTAAAIELLGRFIDEGKDSVKFANSLLEHFRNLAVSKIQGASSGLIDLPKDTIERIYKQGQRISLQEIIYMFNVLNNAQDLMRKPGFERIQLELAVIKLSNRQAAVPAPQSQSAQVVGAKVKPEPAPALSGGVAQRVVPVERAASPPISIDLDKVRSVWPLALEKIKSDKISAALFLMEGSLFDISGSVLTINFPGQFVFYKEALERQENRFIIEKHLRQATGSSDMVVKFTVSDSAVSQAAAAPGPALAQQVVSNADASIPLKTQDAGRSPHSEEIVQSAMKIFKGRIVKKQLPA